MPLAPLSARASHPLRVAAVLTAVTALSSVAATAQAATRRFGSPAGSHSGSSFGVLPSGGVYNGTQALTQLRTIAATTRAASAVGALINGSQSSDGDTGYITVAVDGTRAAKVSLTGSLSVQLYQSPTEEYV